MLRLVLKDRTALHDEFDVFECADVRQRIARNAGFENFRDYKHQAKGRFDYTPDDCFAFHEAFATGDSWGAVAEAYSRLVEEALGAGGDAASTLDRWIASRARPSAPWPG